MAEPLFVGIDAGTSVIKAVAFAFNGQQIAATALPNTYINLPDGGVEQDMARTWTDTVQVLRLMADQVPGLSDRLAAIAVTGQGDGTWLMDKDGEPTAPAWLWLDARAAAIAEEFKGHAAYAAHFARTATGITPCQQSAQLVWLKRNRPEVLARSASAHHCKDWLYFKLTGARVTDPSEGNFTFGHYADRRYQPDILDVLDASDLKRLLPPMVDGAQITQGLSASAAKATGLKPGTPVSLGYVDVVCSGLGGGLFDVEGRAGCTIVGSTGMHMRMRPSKEVILNPEGTGLTMCVPEPGMVAQMQSNMASTLNIDWLLDLALGILADQGTVRTRGDLLKGMDARVLAAEPGAVLFHPYISRAGERGPFLDPHARAGFAGLEQGMGFAQMMRSVFEGLCHAARDCYEAVGGAPQEVRVTGGAARSEALRAMLASALKADIRTVSREEAGAAGAVMMAAVQQKVFPDMAAAVARWVDPMLGAVTKPDATLAKVFDQTFPLYKSMRTEMRPIWRGLRQARA